MSSFANDDDDDEANKNLKNDDESGSKSDNWLHEYQQGCDWEIYCTEISEIFEGTKFVVLSEKLYEKFGLTLFGLRIEGNTTTTSTTTISTITTTTTTITTTRFES